MRLLAEQQEPQGGRRPEEPKDHPLALVGAPADPGAALQQENQVARRRELFGDQLTAVEAPEAGRRSDPVPDGTGQSREDDVLLQPGVQQRTLPLRCGSAAAFAHTRVPTGSHQIPP